MTTLAIVLLVAAGVVVLASVARGISHYRSVMRREWPKVPPGNDDDW
jgi:hypothetical protein